MYVALWCVFAPETLGWHSVATMATWFMTLVIQRAEHRDTHDRHYGLGSFKDWPRRGVYFFFSANVIVIVRPVEKREIYWTALKPLALAQHPPCRDCVISERRPQFTSRDFLVLALQEISRKKPVLKKPISNSGLA